ncbi:hypothetical protein P280DRAFT_520197 [Massarina eburnea CBS 473.64]|uniref:Gfd2/YDR514C-like C-terminal domain-containing protein n=1 Tax=Massarina eburnea CBS 473.64 TaxID=1395130 RepID=A0A6A6RTA4_9PLEO|nr:hypothetical protein P280DRAFT_520197 [Massarina eburnea CBS 473.64]
MYNYPSSSASSTPPPSYEALNRSLNNVFISKTAMQQSPSMHRPSTPIDWINECFRNAFKTGHLRHIDVFAWIHGRKPDLILPNHVGDAFQDAVCVGVDLEQMVGDRSKAVTEIGVFTLPVKRVVNGETFLSPLVNMEVHHARVRENAHKESDPPLGPFADKFQFGCSTFVTMDECRTLLRRCLGLENPVPRRTRHIVLIGHAISNDVEDINEQFGINLDDAGVIAVTLDTQIMAGELGIGHAAGKPISLGKLIDLLDIKVDYLHNGGNDIVATVLAAYAMLKMVQNFPDDHRGNQAYLLHSLRDH